MSNVLDFPRRRSLVEPLPYAAAAFLVAVLAAGYATVLNRPGTAVAAPSFSLCSAPPHRDCVVDGDTFYLGADKIRIADIDAPETHPARCTYEADLGRRATHRLRDLLNARPFEVRTYERDTDRYGRKLRIVARDGHSIGGMLVSEGLARDWAGKRNPWCG